MRGAPRPVGRREQPRGRPAPTSPPVTRVVATALLLATLAPALPFGGLGARTADARPQRGADFAPSSDEWNGLGYLVETAREAQVDLRVARTLDWSTVSEDEVLFVVAPHAAPEGPQIQALLAFVRAGGRVIVADDFRAGARWVRPFGMELVGQAGEASSYAGGARHLPQLQGGTAVGAFLGFHVEQVVLNHPAAVLADGGGGGWRHTPLGRYVDGVRAWIMEAQQPGKQGRVLALADPSALINAMVRRFYGNKQLSANLLRYYCFEGEPCRVRLLANLQHITGTFTAKHPGDGVPDVRERLQASVAAAAKLLQRRELRLLWWLAVVAALLAPVLLAARMPGPRLPPTPGSSAGDGRLRGTVRAWLARPDADYRRPSLQLARHLTRLVEQAERRGRRREVQAPVDGFDTLPAAVTRLVRTGRLSSRAGQRIQGLVGELRHVAGEQAEPVDRVRFTQLSAEVEWAEQVLSHTVR